MKATREELCLFHYPDVTHKGYWKVFLQWRVFYKFSEKQICPICASKCLTHVFRTQGSRLLFTYYLFHVYITSPFICSKVSHFFLAHLVSTHLNSALISHRGAPTPLVPKWNFYASSPNPAPLPVSSVSTGTTLWKSCSLAPPLFSMVLEMKPKALKMLGKHSPTELHPKTLSGHFYQIICLFLLFSFLKIPLNPPLSSCPSYYCCTVLLL